MGDTSGDTSHPPPAAEEGASAGVSKGASKGISPPPAAGRPDRRSGGAAPEGSKNPAPEGPKDPAPEGAKNPAPERTRSDEGRRRRGRADGGRPDRQEPGRREPDRRKSERRNPDRESAARESAGRERADREKAGREKADRENADRENADREKTDRERSDRRKSDRQESDRQQSDRGKPGREKPDREPAGSRNAGREEPEASGDPRVRSTRSGRPSGPGRRRGGARRPDSSRAPAGERPPREPKARESNRESRSREPNRASRSGESGSGEPKSGEPKGKRAAGEVVAGVRVVADEAGLRQLAAEIRAAGAFALDTEFIPEHRLVPELGLIQVATDSLEAVVDPLAVPALTPLFELIADPGVRKVVHSGRHDFEIFHALGGVAPRNVFDTQVAAAVIGHQRKLQIALRTLVAGFVGREISKQEQMSDWLARPLAPRQIEYAISDVRYLLPLERKLRERARALGRLGWLEEEMAPLSREDSYGPPEPEDAYRALDGAGFTPEQRGALRALTAWRERRARHTNRPRVKILKDGVVRDLARRGPRNHDQLLAPYRSGDGRRPPKGDPRTAAQTRGVLEKHGAEVLRVLRQGAAQPVVFTGSGKVERRAAPESLALLLETWLKLRAAEHGVAPDLLATQEELRAIAAAWPQEAKGVRTLTGFRRRLLGEDLLLILSGKAVIQVGAPDAEGDRPPIRLARLGVLGRLSLRFP